MENSSETKEFHLPLEMQFAMRKAEVHAQELDRDELICALLNLYHQRLMEWNALKALMAEEQIDIDFDIPTDIEITELSLQFLQDDDEDEEPLLS
jgi:hypothetical protein